jgi:hypothetical protein
LEPVIANDLPAMMTVALALRAVRDARLFRVESTTFAGYLAHKFDLSPDAIAVAADAISAEAILRDLALSTEEQGGRTVGFGRYALEPAIRTLKGRQTGRPRKGEERIKRKL